MNSRETRSRTSRPRRLWGVTNKTTRFALPAFALAVSTLIGCAGPLEKPVPPAKSTSSGLALAPPVTSQATTSEAGLLIPGLPAPTTSAVATKPTYDLAGDLLERVADAKKRVGHGTETAVVGEVFVLVGARGFTGPAFAASRDLVSRALGAFYNGRFDKRPSEAITVYLFGDAGTYTGFCKTHLHEPCISVYGFYWPSERWMVMNAGLGIGTLTHELVHPLVEADFPRAPTWLNEGIASIFEAPSLPKAGEIHGVKNWRLPRLRGALSSAERPKALPHTLFGMRDETFRDDDESLHYALARYFCQWLDERGKLWEFYHAYRDARDEDPTGEKSFVKVVGKTPLEMESAFLGWVTRL